MTNTLGLSKPKVDKTGSVFQESLEKVAQALEVERNKLVERAHQDSNQIIAKAREEADKIISQARQRAEVESDKLIAKIREETERILEKSREKASTEARQESARIINETREKTAQIITQIIERGRTQAKSKFVQAASEARNRLESEKSKLLTVTKSIEQIIGETETNIQAGIEHLTTVITEIEEKLRLLNEIPHGEIVISSQQVADESKSIEQIIDETETNVQAVIEQLADVVTENERKLKLINKIPHRAAAISSQQVAEEAKITEHTENLEKQEIEQEDRKEAMAKTEELKETESSAYIDKRIQAGIALLELNKNEEALEVFVKVIGLDPKNAIAWRKKGVILGILGKHKESLEAFNRTICLAPKDITAWHNKAVALTKLGRKKEAEEAKATEKQLIKEYPEEYKALLTKNK